MNGDVNRNNKKGGDGGQIFIFANKIQGKGKIQADGGEGSIGGKGGSVLVVSNENKFTGEISTKGGMSSTESGSSKAEASDFYQKEAPTLVRRVAWIVEWLKRVFRIRKGSKLYKTKIVLVIILFIVLFFVGIAVVRDRPSFSFTMSGSGFGPEKPNAPLEMSFGYEGILRNTFDSKRTLERIDYYFWKEKEFGSTYGYGYMMGEIYDLSADEEKKQIKLPILFEPNEAKHVRIIFTVHLENENDLMNKFQRVCFGAFCHWDSNIELAFKDSKGNIYDEKGGLLNSDVVDDWWVLPNDKIFSRKSMSKAALFSKIVVWRMKRFFHIIN